MKAALSSVAAKSGVVALDVGLYLRDSAHPFLQKYQEMSSDGCVRTDRKLSSMVWTFHVPKPRKVSVWGFLEP
jgi:hypothetical protein